jgi:hypothetical protein
MRSKNKLIPAFEELEQQVQNQEPEPAPLNEVDMAPLEEVNADADFVSDQIEEAEEVHASMGETAEILESYGDEEAPEGVVKVASVAVEHLCNQVSYRRSKMIASMESFGKEKGSTKQLASELRVAQEMIEKGIQIGQEGLLETITKSFEMAFTTDEKVLQKLRSANAGYEQGTLKETDIESPPWCRFIPSGSETFTPADAVKLAGILSKLSSDDKLVRLINDLATCTKKLTEEVRGNWFVSNKNDIARIEKIGDDVKQIREEIGEGENISSSYKAKTFKPLDSASQKQLSAELIKVLKDDKVTASLKKQGSASVAFGLWTLWQYNFRLKTIGGAVVGGAVGGLAGRAVGGAIGSIAGGNVGGKVGAVVGFASAEDISKSIAVNKQIFAVLSGIKDIMKQKTKIANALVSYIDDSVK